VQAAVPEVGDNIELAFGGDVTVRADVREQLGYAVWLSVPPVIEAGRRLLVRWEVGGRGVTASARVVRSSARQGLCLAIGSYAHGNRRRRGATRHAPRSPLCCVLESAPGVEVGGPVVDLSFGGCCISVPAAEQPSPAPVVVEFRRGDASLVDGIPARITSVDEPSGSDRHVHVAFASVGVAALRIAALLGPVTGDRSADAA
jgi:PilZ domain-containing protein